MSSLPRSRAASPLSFSFLVMVCRPIEATVSTKSPRPFTFCVICPSASVTDIATGLVMFPLANTLIVAKASPSWVIESRTMPVTTVSCAFAGIAAIRGSRNSRQSARHFILLLIMFVSYSYLFSVIAAYCRSKSCMLSPSSCIWRKTPGSVLRRKSSRRCRKMSSRAPSATK